MECLVLPLQDKLEEWKKFVINLDKEHSKGTSRLVFTSHELVHLLPAVGAACVATAALTDWHSCYGC